MNQQEATQIIALIGALNGNKEAAQAVQRGLEPHWFERLTDGTADRWIPILEAFARDGDVEIKQYGGWWRQESNATFNAALECYRPVTPKPLCVWAVVRGRNIVCVNFSEGATNLAAREGDRVVKLEEVAK